MMDLQHSLGQLSSEDVRMLMTALMNFQTFARDFLSMVSIRIWPWQRRHAMIYR